MTELFSDFDVDECVKDLREDLRERGIEALLRKSKRRSRAHVIRVKCNDADFERIVAIAREYQGLMYHAGLCGWYINFKLERVENHD